MPGSGQKCARELFTLHLPKAQKALFAGRMVDTPFQGALAELFVTHRMGWGSVSGPEVDKYDALRGQLKVEIKSSTNGRKPSPKDKEYDEFCWLQLERRGTEIWATRLTVGPKHEPHTVDRLGGEVPIFDAKFASGSNHWLKEAGLIQVAFR
jgi:hypothetical protein